jgi:excisionase family DNA binding protein
MTHDNSPVLPRLLTSREVGALFRIDPKTVSRWAKSGRIACVRTPTGQPRFRETDILAYLKDGK